MNLKWCRLCLKLHATLVNVDKDVMDMFYAITQNKLDHDLRAVSMCCKCYLKIKLAFSIREQFLDADRQFKENIKSGIHPGIVLQKHCITSIREEISLPSFSAFGDNYCIICSMFVGVQADGMRTHLKLHFNMKPHSCFVCALQFNTLIDLKRHQWFDKHIVLNSCNICGRSFRYKSLYDVHVKHCKHVQNESHYEDQPSSKEEYSNDCCDSPTIDGPKSKHKVVRNCKSRSLCHICHKSVNKLKQHLTTHFPTQRYRCTHCDRSYKHMATLRAHKWQCTTSTLHSNKASDQIRQQHCGTALADKLIPQQDATLSSFPCLVCRKQYKSTLALKRHQYLHDRVKCNICNRSVIKVNLANHQKWHDRVPVMCDICGNVYRNEMSLQYHMEKHKEKEIYECNLCNMSFKLRYRFHAHQLVHSGEKNYSCEICGKSFFHSLGLTKHKRSIHIKPKSYQCSHCHRLFSASYTLKSHERTHTHETPYRCEYCGRAFTQKSSLNTHKLSQHGDRKPITFKCTKCDKGYPTQCGLTTHYINDH